MKATKVDFGARAKGEAAELGRGVIVACQPKSALLEVGGAGAEGKTTRVRTRAAAEGEKRSLFVHVHFGGVKNVLVSYNDILGVRKVTEEKTWSRFCPETVTSIFRWSPFCSEIVTLSFGGVTDLAPNRDVGVCGLRFVPKS